VFDREYRGFCFFFSTRSFGVRFPFKLLLAISLVLSSISFAIANPSHSWLISQQTTDGSFGNSNDIAISSQATGETVTALMLDSILAPSALQPALNYLNTGDVSHTETVARQIVVAVTLNGSADNSLIQKLNLLQNENGGFGSYAGYESDAVSTSWALRAYAASHLNNSVVAKAINYLVTTANTDKGWRVDNASSLAVTAEVLIALNAFKQYAAVPPAIASARTYLTAQKHTDGLWGQDFESALVLSALSYGAPSIAELQASADLLAAKQDASASWSGDVYTTALVLQAIKRVNSLSTTGNSNGSLQGQVLLAGSSQPIANATVSVAEGTTSVKTDINGRFTLTGLKEGLVTLVVQKSGFQAVSKATQINLPLVNNAGQIYLAQSAVTAVLSGHVHDSNTSANISPATLTLTGASSLSLTTNALGSFEVTTLAPGSYNYTIAAAGYYPVSGSFSVAAGHALINQGLVSTQTPLVDNPAPLTGSVIDGTTKLPVPFASVSVDGIPVLVDLNGQFTTASIARGTHALSISAPGYLSGQFTFNFASGASGNLGNLSIFNTSSSDAAQKLELLAKSVDGVSGAPVMNATVKVLNSAILGITNVQGVTTLSNIPNLQFEIEITAAGYLTQQYSIEASGFGSVAGTFNLTPQTPNNDVFTLSGFVRDSATNFPLADAELSIPGVSNVVSGADGSYEFVGLKKVPFTIRAVMNGYVPFQKDIHITEAAGAYKYDVELAFDNTANLFSIQSADVAASVDPDSQAIVNVSVKNLSAESQSAILLAHVMDASGAEIVVLSPKIPNTETTSPHVTFNANEIINFEMPWSVEQAAAGTYSIVIEVVENATMSRDLPRGHILASHTVNTLVNGASKFGGALELSPPLLQAGAKTPVAISAVLRNTGNQLLAAGEYSLRIFGDDETQPVHTKTVSVDAVEQNGVFIVDFGQWSPSPELAGQLHAKIVRSDAITGVVNTELYIGDVAKAQFTVDKNVLPEGNNNIKGNIHLTGVDTTISKGTDPLLDVVKTAVEKGARFTGPAATTWQKTNNCLGCHTQAQTLAGLGSALDKTNIDQQMANYFLNEIATGPRASGAINTHDNNGQPDSSTLLANWALTEWRKPEESINSLVAGVGYIWSIRKSSGGQMRWSTDYTVGWLSNDYGATALATLAAVRAKEMINKIEVLPSNYQWNVGYPLNTGRTGNNAIKVVGGYLYAAKPNGWMERIDLTTKASVVLFSSLAGVSGRINGLDFDKSGNFLMATEQGKVLRVTPSGSILNTYPLCTQQSGGLVVGPSDEIYVACIYENKIRRIDANDQITTLVTGGLLNNPYGLAWHSNGYLLIANYTANQILKMTVSGDLSLYANGLSSKPVHLAEGPNGDVFVTGNKTRSESNGLDLVRENGTARRVLLSEDRWGVAVDSNGIIYVSNNASTQFASVKTIPLNTSVVDSYVAALPNVIAFYGATFNINDLNNINQANRLIGLGEIQKIYPNDPALQSLIQPLAAALKARQSDNGGWGLSGKSLVTKTDPLITALVGIALEYTSPSSQDPMVRNAISYLLNTQKANGSWHSSESVFTTDLGSTSLVMVYLPKAIERLGGLDVKVNVNLPSNVVLSAPTLTPTSQTAGTDGTTQYLWDVKGVTGSGRDISFGLAVNDLALGEIRKVASLATLSFGNSFTSETIVRDIEIPSVNALSQLTLAVSTDKAIYGANEPVQIASLATNKGPAFAGGNVKLAIRATGYVSLLDSLVLNPVTSLAQGQSNSVPNSWNTGTVFAGDYEVFGQLLDNSGRVLAEATAPFAISGSATNNQLLGSQVFTDKSRYLNTESAHIDTRVLNTALNVIHDPVLGRLTITHASDNSVAFTRSYAIPQLVIGAQTANQEDLGLTELALGQYKVLWQVYDAQGVTLITQSTAQFDVVQDVHGLIGGTVTVKSASIERGNAQVCDFTVVNKTATAISALAVTETVINLDAESVLNTFNVTANLAGNTAQTDTRPLSTAGYPIGQYACVLQAQLEGQTLNLGQALFTVTEQPFKLDAELKLQAQGRLLVLIDVAQTPNEELYLKSLLDNAGWLYTVVNNATDFDTQLTQGGYSSYALLSELVTLTPQTRDKLKLRIGAGEGLYVSNGYDRRHQSLEDVLGIRVHAKQARGSGVKFKQSLLSDAWTYNFTEPVNALTFDITSAIQVGEYVLAAPGTGAAGALGAAEEYNAFVFEDFASLSSAVEGRLGVGGNLNINNFGIGDKLDPKKLGDVVVVGGNATFPSGKVYYGNLIAGGSVAGVGAPVVNGMANGTSVKGQITTLPVEFAGEQEYLKELSANIAKLPSTGTYTFQYGIYTVKGDCSSKVQVFNVNAADLATTNTLYNSCIPVGATVVFNILGDTATLKNMGMQSLTALREKVLFNFPTATKVNMTSVGIEGSVLAPYAQFYNPSGSINGRLIAKSWLSNNYGWVGINNIKFTGDLSAAVLAGTKNAAAIHRYQLGKTAFAGFDVLKQAFGLNQQQIPGASNTFEQLLLSSLVYVSPDAILPKANRVMPYKMELQNQASTPVNAKVILTLSNGLKMMNAQGFTASTTAGEWVYTAALTGNASTAQKLYVQLPKDVAKTEQIRLRVQTGDGQTAVIRVDKNYSVTTQ
jgi:choice-of-anchor A domain-containing protein